MKSITDVLIKFLPGIISAIIASYLSAKWSLRKIYSEKWWERKERAYSDIITSLYDIMIYYEYKYDYYMQGLELLDEENREFKEKYKEANLKLKKVSSIGGFVISKDAADALYSLSARPNIEWGENPPWEIIVKEFDYHKIILDKIVAIANKDLKVKKA